MTPKSRFHFDKPSPSGGALIEREEDPMYAVAFTPAQLDRLFRGAGFMIEKNLHGAWTGDLTCRTYQDALLLRKKSWLGRWFDKLKTGATGED